MFGRFPDLDGSVPLFATREGRGKRICGSWESAEQESAVFTAVGHKTHENVV